jgi:hypothetical protein
MAEVLISPGVLARENDSSFVSKRPVTVGAAIIGPTAKGPVEIPTVVTTWNQFQNIFGTTLESGSIDDKKNYTYFTSITAYNYFANGGQSLLVARVVSGSGTSYSPATSSRVANSFTSASFVLETFSEGVIMNSTSTETAGGNLPSGSADNVRWQIVNARSASGTFDLLIRRGNDNALQPTVLETWTNLTLDPNSSNYIARVIGDFKEVLDTTSTPAQIAYSGSFANRSNYVRVSAVNYTTPNFFDNAGIFKPQFTGSIPVNASGTFGGAIGNIPGGVNFYNNINSTNTQGLKGSDYDNMIDLFSNSDDYKFNVLFTPGLYNTDYTGPIGDLIQTAQNRGDFIYVIDPVAYGSTVSLASDEAGKRDTSYGAMYWPWVQVVEPSTGEYVWVPASVSIAGVYAYNDSVAEPWFAPAGINRGGLNTVVRAEKKLSQGNRNDLYAAKVNPIATFPGQGVVVYGQKTLQLRASALDRVNVRRLLIALKSYISQIANTLVFEQNTIATRNQFLSQVNPYLTSVQQRQGLYAFKVIMNETNNGPDIIDRNELVGQIYLQPTKTAEFIYLDFNVTPTGASFPA